MSDKLINFIKSIPNEIIQVNKSFYLVKTPGFVLIIPTRYQNLSIDSFQRRIDERLKSLYELMNEVGDGVIMSNHYESTALSQEELNNNIPSGSRVNAEFSNGKEIIYVHMSDSSGEKLFNLAELTGFNKIKLLDSGKAVIAWKTVHKELNNPNLQLYGLGSDIIGSALIIT